MAASRRSLRALAERLGILPAYVDADGHTRRTRDATRVALAAAMGIDASSEAAATRAQGELDRREAQGALDPVRVAPARSREAQRFRLRQPVELEGPVDWELELHTEDGGSARAQGSLAAGGRRRAPWLHVRARVEPGYHVARLRLASSRASLEAEQRLIATPRRCVGVREKLGRSRGYGIWANLYSVRSRRGWGVGDLGDLRALARFAGSAGAAFLGVNPLHAVWNRGLQVSPYSPVTRLYRSVAYLDVGAVPELADCPAARSRLESASFQRALERLRDRDAVSYEDVVRLKRELLVPLHESFVARHGGGETARGRAYARYLRREGEPLRDFATFLVLRARFGERLPGALRQARSAEVARFRRERAREVGLECWIQFEIDRQLAAAAGAARRAGLAIGLYTDLAVGSAPSGSDPWAFPELFATGASVGAPPDAYAREGQDWGLPPLDPHALRRDAYAYWVRLLRAGFAHAGALRLDHVMGLFRLFWIPAGRPASEGAYVRQPAHDLLGILALESRRHGALVIGEDLGTVPRGLQARLARRGVLSSRVLIFERERSGGFRPAARYSRRALATANTHDLPPLAGWLTGRDLELRRALGGIADDAGLARARAGRERERQALLRRLVADGAARSASEAEADPSAAVTRFLCRTPAPLVGLSLDDLTGETEPVNLPGVPQEAHPSWTRRMAVGLEQLRAHPAVRSSLDAVPRTRRIGGRGTSRRSSS